MKHSRKFKQFIFEQRQRKIWNSWEHFADYINNAKPEYCQKWGGLSAEALRHIYRRYVEKERDSVGVPVRYSARRDMEVVGNIGIIADPHLPFVRHDYLDFLQANGKKYDCETWVMIGDLLDQHANSRHISNPGGYSSGHEFEAAKKQVKKWFEVFPQMYCVVGNHDTIYFKRSEEAGISPYYLQTFEDLLELPTGWQWALSWQWGNTLFTHGTGSSGRSGAINKAISFGCNIVQGHSHTIAGVQYHRTLAGQLWAMAVGCGVNEKAYAFNYAREAKTLYQNGMGIIFAKDNIPLYIPMD